LPTRRSAALPDFVLRASEVNAGRARLTEDGRGVLGAAPGIPFPRPESGLQAIWNHMLRWRFLGLRRRVGFAAPLASGRYTLWRIDDRTLYPYNAPDADPRATGGTSQLLIYVVVAPAAYARLALLSRQPLNYTGEGTSYWFWSPGDRRVTFSADTAFDVPNGMAEGLRTVAGARSFCPTTPMRSTTRPGATGTSCAPAGLIPPSRATSCAGPGSWRHG
jgi:hypothetical protein